MKLMTCLVILMSMLPASAPAEESAPRYERRWVWVMSNLLVDNEADRLVALVEKAGREGFNGLVLSDYKLNFLERMPRSYFEHVDRVKKAANGAGVEIIPCLFSIGYSNGLLSLDPNLAEGMLVADAPFRVKGRDAVLLADTSASLKNGDLEATKGNVFSGFGYQDAPGEATFADRDVFHQGKLSCRMQNFEAVPVCRLIQSVKVRPHANYRLSCWSKTRDLKPVDAFRLMAVGSSGRQLSFQEGGLQETRDWTRLEVAFNSQGETEVNLYAGLWGGRQGTLWLDDLEFEELSLVNVLRRDGCPLRVSSDDGKVVYREGQDFEPVIDPKLGRVPYEGEYEFHHEGASLRVATTSRIKDGDRLKVSWYHPALVLSGYAMCCLSEPKMYEILGDQARRVEELFHPRTVFMQHDEIRVANWCHACQSRKLTAGALLADNVRRCREILKVTSPGARVVVWSDMFDPNHNAVKGPYYLVNGSLEGSWLGLDPSVTIANWNGGKPKASLDFFAARGHSQIIAGYYDGDDNFASWDSAARGVAGIEGFMYTTWQSRYDDLARYGKLIRREVK